jgi:CheY-like chemotaxis protein
MEPRTFKKILLLDDEPGVVFALKLLLGALKFEVTETNQPERAVELLATEAHFDLFLCDLKMPRMNGMAVLAETRRLRPNLPFLLMSAHATTVEVAEAKQRGASGFIAKPFSPEELESALSALGR